MVTHTNYINLCAYQVPGDRVLLVQGTTESDIDVPPHAQEDPDVFESWIMDLANEHGITVVMDIDGEFIRLADWIHRGI
jgi:hypothetical protein